ncbi:LytR/AlgR family response regulator transcription factor [Runella slithyformis]|uniref:Two component transcriptional regulator, LytTR family n=1 Tax=Runella slithyformis (strain ATCC 29530 / DSM 19594 / LMG 11500 / NCIMB 11436 / LSU 4) TaxID=761193 RepID=A0A7U3ZKI4_RUNSL|nr:LytTR family DNA-binding domain-containing protein [Runella slithyformis]AEI48863.1 two component transcriptional regulator, LytTR family [Runella slithyformis DSM 19594]
MLTCIIIDDEAHNIEKLQNYIQRHEGLELEFSTTDPIEGLTYLKSHDPDLIFLDIQMEELSGMDLAKIIPDKKKIVFTTASRDYTLGAFEEGVLDYILKPFGYARFENAVQKATDYKKSKEPAAPPPLPTVLKPSGDLFLKGDAKSTLIRIRLEEIYFVEGMGNYAKFHTKSGLETTLITFRDLEGRLPYPHFIRVHKSFIVAYNQIAAIDGSDIVIKIEKKDVKVPIGGIYREGFLKLIQG